ncbi:MAG: chloride channel protein, partial [Granulicatella sp.]
MGLFNSKQFGKSSYIAIGAIIGILVGTTVSLFRLFLGKTLEGVIVVYSYLQESPQWIPLWIIFSMVMAVILGQIVKSDPDIKGSGIPQVELQLQGKMNMNWWSVCWKKFVAGSISIGSGLLLGREGPSIQLGASVAQGVAEGLKSNRVQKNIFISSGAGAGLAAAFNAPIAGLMFVLEEVHHTFSPLVALTTLTAAIVSNFVSLNIFGARPSLNLGNDQLFPMTHYGYVIVLGIILGLFGWVYHHYTLQLPAIYGKLFPFIPNYYY